MDVKNLEKYRQILAKHGHDNVSDEELFEISKNIRQLADVVVAYEKNKPGRDLKNIPWQDN